MSANLVEVGLMLAVVAAAAGLSAAVIARLLPWLRQIALASPNGRSSHKEPTPQGGGLGVVAGTLAVGGAAILLFTASPPASWLALGASTVGLALLGLIDDSRPMPWLVKLLGQTGAAILASLCLPFPVVGTPALILLIAAASFVLVAMINFTNFVDGIDEISVAHAAPALLVPIGLAVMGGLSREYGLLGAALLGALCGFWWWNRHPARIFLGDCGSLPLGLLLGWLALAVALKVHPALALLIIAYPMAEGGFTVLRRLARGARLTEPHRDHAYQRAVDHGTPARTVAAIVAVVGLAGSGLALLSYGVAGTGGVPGSTIGLGLPLAGAVIMICPILLWLRQTREARSSR